MSRDEIFRKANEKINKLQETKESRYRKALLDIRRTIQCHGGVFFFDPPLLRRIDEIVEKALDVK